MKRPTTITSCFISTDSKIESVLCTFSQLNECGFVFQSMRKEWTITYQLEIIDDEIVAVKLATNIIRSMNGRISDNQINLILLSKEERSPCVTAREVLFGIVKLPVTLISDLTSSTTRRSNTGRLPYSTDRISPWVCHLLSLD